MPPVLNSFPFLLCCYRQKVQKFICMYVYSSGQEEIGARASVHTCALVFMSDCSFWNGTCDPKFLYLKYSVLLLKHVKCLI